MLSKFDLFLSDQIPVSINSGAAYSEQPSDNDTENQSSKHGFEEAVYRLYSAGGADPGGVDSDPDLTLEKKLDPDPTLEKQSGSETKVIKLKEDLSFRKILNLAFQTCF